MVADLWCRNPLYRQLRGGRTHAMISANLREMLMRFVDGNAGVRDLEEWLAPSAPELIRDPGSDDAQVVAFVELSLVEYGEGIKGEDSLRQSVGAELSKYPLVAVDFRRAMSTEATSSSATVHEPTMTWLREFDFTQEAA